MANSITTIKLSPDVLRIKRLFLIIILVTLIFILGTSIGFAEYVDNLSTIALFDTDIILTFSGLVIFLISNFFITLQWKNTSYEVKPGEIIITKGIFVISKRVFELRDIESVTIKQNLLGRYLNYGSIGIEKPKLSSSQYISDIPSPAHYQKIILNASKHKR